MNWKGFESLVLASGGATVRLSRLPACGARFVGKGRIIRQPVPCDFIGVHFPTGRAVYLDAKSCELKTRFPVGNNDHVPAHQRDFLVRSGEAGAVSGLLIESVSRRRVYWLGWELLRGRDASVEWDDPRLLDVGPANCLIDFKRIVAADAARGATRWRLA